MENASITNTSARTWRQSAEILVRYNTTIKKDHDLGALLGYSAQEYYSKSFAVSRKGATDWTLNELSTYETLVSSSSSAPAKWGLLSYFGRVGYEFAGRYLLQASLRADAADLSLLPATNRWGYFPAVSVGWTVSEEKFFAPLKDHVSSLKLRASWGQNGSLAALSGYAYSTDMALGGLYPFVMGNSYITSAAPSTMGNDELKWEPPNK